MTYASSLFSCRPPPQRRERGFTLAELVAVLVIIGILAAVAVPRMSNLNEFDTAGFSDQLKSTLQFARKSAIAQRRYVCVQNAGGQITLTIDANPPESTAAEFGGACPFASALELPVPSGHCTPVLANGICAPAGVAIVGPATLQFDARGRASAASTYQAGGRAAISVVQETGLVF